ncbi:hypothetical protein EDC61_10147 [Sulfuritortus calidifontis]|uniref:Formylmethanofuran dehydrogenase subunit E domain-containing protein n=1 Tax=Sulfuritortus calidifontis TaxID=1914471 RepID=A0A4R3JYL1_9PROT|nr:hypothetical protein [Sulfuritortus calidifontis]TCS73825.1 hypothetical protein EDC61_10147 [Sulfuritortus calidifontis]
MSFPPFFKEVRRIRLNDPLAALLGAAEAGELEYRYEDAVKLAGHSCPTVAGAYLMTLKALGRLYPDRLPERGGVRVELREAQAAGTTGVTAAVAGLITGAAGEGGFKGLGGRFSRRGLLSFAVDMAGELRFTRADTGAAVEAAYHPEIVPPDPAMQPLMARLMSGEARMDERQEFGRLWQLRVKRLLIDHIDDPDLIVLS